MKNTTFDVVDFGGCKQSGVLRFLDCIADDRNLGGVAGYQAINEKLKDRECSRERKHG